MTPELVLILNETHVEKIPRHLLIEDRTLPREMGWRGVMKSAEQRAERDSHLNGHLGVTQHQCSSKYFHNLLPMPCSDPARFRRSGGVLQ